ncbi:hypothetical protein JVU11DRAFT_247 [Chiua virens]|nr:hypothetical protein JVU11DRAFT_247 [Chiua virens]
MATSGCVSTIPSITLTLARASCDCRDVSWMASPDDVDPVLAMPGMLEFTSTLSVHGPSCPPRAISLRFDGASHDTVDNQALMLGIAQMIAGLFLLYQLGESLVVRAFAIVSHAVATIQRVRTHMDVWGSSNETLTEQYDWLRDQVLSQQDRIARLDAEAESCKKTIAELSTMIEGDKKAVESISKSFKLLQLSVEGNGARISRVKADSARKIHVLESRVTEIQAKLAIVKTVALPSNISSTAQTAREARTFAGIDRRLEHTEFMREIEELCAEMSGSAYGSASTVTGDVSSPSDAETVATRDNGRSKKIKVKKPKIYRESLSIVSENVARHCVSTSPGPPPTIPLPPLPTETRLFAKDIGKENNACKRSSMTVQCSQKTQPGAGRLNVGDRIPRTTSKGTQSGTGLSRKTSAVSLPSPPEASLACLGRSDSLGIGSIDLRCPTSDAVETGKCLTSHGGSATPVRQPKTVEVASMRTPPSPSGSRLPRPAKKERIFRLPTSTSLAALDAALQAMQVADSSCNDLLGPLPAIDHLEDDFYFVLTAPVPPITTKRDKIESVRVSPERGNVDVKLESGTCE